MKADTETRSISQEYDLPYSPAKVWRSLTEPKLLAGWLMSNDIRPVVGKNFTFTAEPTPWWDGIVHCEVLEVDPGKRISYTWRTGVLAARHRGHLDGNADVIRWDTAFAGALGL